MNHQKKKDETIKKVIKRDLYCSFTPEINRRSSKMSDRTLASKKANNKNSFNGIKDINTGATLKKAEPGKHYHSCYTHPMDSSLYVLEMDTFDTPIKQHKHDDRQKAMNRLTKKGKNNSEREAVYLPDGVREKMVRNVFQRTDITGVENSNGKGDCDADIEFMPRAEVINKVLYESERDIAVFNLA